MKLLTSISIFYISEFACSYFLSEFSLNLSNKDFYSVYYFFINFLKYVFVSNILSWYPFRKFLLITAKCNSLAKIVLLSYKPFLYSFVSSFLLLNSIYYKIPSLSLHLSSIKSSNCFKQIIFSEISSTLKIF